MKFDEKIQLIIVGESSVGKTSIVNKYIWNKNKIKPFYYLIYYLKIIKNFSI